MFPLVVSFYTKNTPYQLDAHHLQASCDKFGLEHHIEGIDSYGSWELNCSYKPFFIGEKLKQFQRPILWVDVDAVFVQKPRPLKLFANDFAAYYQKELANDHLSKVRSSVVYANYTETGFKIIRDWMQESQRMLVDPARTTEFWDQAALRNVAVQEDFKNVKCLPLSYVAILGHPFDSKCKKPVMMHLQASRRSKEKVKK
jgi:hypothetical protein